MKIQLAKATIKTTGEQFWYEKKCAWNRFYYSFDDGATWHRTMTAAYRAASESDSLHRVGEVKVTTVAA